MTSLPTYFLSHGGGPWPFIPEMKTAFRKTVEALQALPASLPTKPKAILSITSHWEEDEFMVSSAAQPQMIYDYGGFPEHTYHVKYPAPGSPEVAMRVQELVKNAGMNCGVDSARGFDHGTFVPLVLMYPNADVPVVSVSIKKGYDSEEHIRFGEALAPLRNEGVLIVGSGLTYHNLRMFGPSGSKISEEFETWIFAAISAEKTEKRTEGLNHWEQAPGARIAHPQEDHLIPLMAAFGASGRSRGRRLFTDRVWDVTMASYLFE
jgi:aromatic ring-opening dioxygenase catalytic subunit (LigB family)